MMLRFAEYLEEAKTIYDSLDSSKPEETERHKRQYYDDSNPEGHFQKSDGYYVLNRDRTDLHPNYSTGKQVKLTSIQKMHDKNGVLRYHGITEHGNAIPMSHFKKPSINRAGKNQQKLEQEQIGYLQQVINDKMAANGHVPIRVRTPNGEVHEITGIKQVQGGWPKADAYLHDKYGNPVHWMSLKGDKFQQWGGYKDLENSPLMQSYIKELQDHKEKVAPGEKYLPKGAAYHIKLDSEDPEQKKLIHRSMFGPGHGGEYGPHNVHAIYSGNTIGLKKGDDGVFELDPTALYVNRNDDTSDISDAKILVTHRAGMNQQGSGGRVMVSHAGNVGNSRDIRTGERAVPLRTAVAREKPIAKPAQKPTPMQIATQRQQTQTRTTAPAPAPQARTVSRNKPTQRTNFGVAGDNPDSPMHAWRGSHDSSIGNKEFRDPL
mgnify:CR=1 FL=1